MRTTLTIDDDLAKVIKDLCHERGASFKSIVNELLRRGLSTADKPPPSPEPFRVRAIARGFRPGIDPLKLNRLADELETDRFAEQDHSGAGAG
jgi:hypothetical protein